MTEERINEETIRQTLRQVIDPELDCNIVDLGLIYDIQVEGAKVAVRMTLTTPGCPMHESIAMGVQSAILNLERVEEVEVSLVWEPRWTPDCMTEYGRRRLGIE